MADSQAKRRLRAEQRRERDQDERKFEEEVEKRVRGLAVAEAAGRRFAAEQDGDRFSFPEGGRTLSDDLAVPPREVQWSIEDLHPAGGNTLLVAQLKTGKTTLLLNLVKALADDEPFLGRFSVARLSGRVAFWNYELDADMFRRWARDVRVEHPERVAEPLHLRGTMLPIWLPERADQAAKWLRDNEVEFLIIDPAAAAWRGLVDNENDNGQLAAFTHALDALKRRAGVRDLVLATHMGRQAFEEDAERSRGGTRLEDWMDAGWYLRKDSTGRRTFRAMGRDVSLEAIDLSYQDAERRMQFTGQTRDERRVSDGVQNVVDALSQLEHAGDYPATTRTLEAATEGNKNDLSRWIQEADRAGLIKREKVGKAKLCSLTVEGRKRVERKVSRRRKRGRTK
jgi:RecA-family ATPase